MEKNKSRTEKMIAVQVREKRMDDCIRIYKRKGTMVPYIKTYRDLSMKEKADFLDDAMTRLKMSPPKRNPFRKEG